MHVFFAAGPECADLGDGFSHFNQVAPQQPPACAATHTGEAKADIDFRRPPALVGYQEQQPSQNGADGMGDRQRQDGEQMERQFEKKRSHQGAGMISRKLRMARNSPTSFSGSFESGWYAASNWPMP